MSSVRDSKQRQWLNLHNILCNNHYSIRDLSYTLRYADIQNNAPPRSIHETRKAGLIESSFGSSGSVVIVTPTLTFENRKQRIEISKE